MSSYNTRKLNNFLERRRTAGAVLRDLSERYRIAKEDFARYRNIIMTNAERRAINSGLIQRLMDLPADQALALKAKDVEEFKFTSPHGKEVEAYTGVQWNAYHRFIDYRERCHLLNSQREAAQTAFQEHFAIAPKLVDAVTAWGFKKPDLFF